MKPFDEDQSTDTDPLDGGMVADFDWDELYRSFGEAGDEKGDEINQKLAYAIRSITQFILAVDYTQPGAASIIGRRFVAFAWVLNPDLFANSPSLTTLAKKLKCTPACLAQHSGQATRRFNIRNRGQAHAWNRKAA